MAAQPPTGPRHDSPRRRLTDGLAHLSLPLRLAILAVLVAGGVVATVISLGSGRSSSPSAAQADRHLVAVDTITDQPYLIFRDTVLDRDYGRLAVTSAAHPNAERALLPLKCTRVAFAGGRGLCVTTSQGLYTSTRALILNSQFQTTATVTLQGYPNRARVSADGRYGATTDFVSGDSYATAGFSTRTNIIDMRTGKVLFDLEKLHVTRDGQTFSNVNFNFWGVTFASDDQHFYATLGSGSSTYLLRGDIATEQATVLRSGVECPSLSPDGTRIAFKKRLPGSTVRWQLAVLDLSTLQDHPLAETRSVDDQPYWLNNTTVAYGLASGSNSQTTTGLSALTAGGSVPTDMWEVPADGSGSPKLLVSGAWSAELVP